MERIKVTTYFLEMQAAPQAEARKAPPNTEVVKAGPLSRRSYLALYHGVGEPWLWYERSDLNDAELAKLIAAPGVEIYLLKKDGETAGFCELQTGPETQILYFGLMPDFIGAGLGTYFLDWTVRKAFESKIERLWVHTCSLDHPRALASYEKTGFRQYRHESGWVCIPKSALSKRESLARTDDA